VTLADLDLATVEVVRWIAMDDDRERGTASSTGGTDAAGVAPPACAVDPDIECPVCAARGRRVRMHPVKAHYQCPDCHYFDSCCM
jgi:hypothetical protein